MIKKLFHNFVIKPAIKPKKRSVVTKKISGIVEGECFIEDNEYKVHVSLEGYSSMLCIPFTKESYELKGREIIFYKQKGEHGYVRVIRNPHDARFRSADKNIFVPFAPNIVITGYVVKIDNKMMFDFKDIDLKKSIYKIYD